MLKMFTEFKRNYDDVALKTSIELASMLANPGSMDDRLADMMKEFLDSQTVDMAKIDNPDLLMEYLISFRYFTDVAKRIKIEETKAVLKEMAGNMSLDDYCKQCPNKSEEDCEDCKVCRDAGKDN